MWVKAKLAYYYYYYKKVPLKTMQPSTPIQGDVQSKRPLPGPWWAFGAAV